jgi:acyl carrier protein
LQEDSLSAITPEKIRTDLLDILSKLADLDTSQVKDADRLREDLGLDSLQSMELLSRISDLYELEIEVEDVMDVQTVADVVQQLGDLIRASAAR